MAWRRHGGMKWHRNGSGENGGGINNRRKRQRKKAA
jgi:hypothetical protein